LHGRGGPAGGRGRRRQRGSDARMVAGQVDRVVANSGAGAKHAGRIRRPGSAALQQQMRGDVWGADERCDDASQATTRHHMRERLSTTLPRTHWSTHWSTHWGTHWSTAAGTARYGLRRDANHASRHRVRVTPHSRCTTRISWPTGTAQCWRPCGHISQLPVLTSHDVTTHPNAACEPLQRPPLARQPAIWPRPINYSSGCTIWPRPRQRMANIAGVNMCCNHGRLPATTFTGLGCSVSGAPCNDGLHYAGGIRGSAWRCCYGQPILLEASYGLARRFRVWLPRRHSALGERQNHWGDRAAISASQPAARLCRGGRPCIKPIYIIFRIVSGQWRRPGLPFARHLARAQSGHVLPHQQLQCNKTQLDCRSRRVWTIMGV
jgi:hypothetical protein